MNQLIYNTTWEQYQKLPGWTQTQAKSFTDCPETYWHEHVAKDMPRRAASPEMQFGSDVESYLQHGEIPGVVVIPPGVLGKNGVKSTNAYKAWLAEQPDDARIVSELEYDRLQAACQAITRQVNQHREASALLNGDSRWQVAATWLCPHTGLDCKGRLDVLTSTAIVDLKTTRSVNAHRFRRQICDLRYHWQAAFYVEGVRRITGAELPFYFVAIENFPPYRVEVFELTDEFLEIGKWDMLAAKEAYVAMRDQPGPWRAATWGTVQTLSPPKWLKDQGIDLFNAIDVAEVEA